MSFEYEFDPAKSAQENIDSFFRHVRSVDPTLGELLQKNISILLPLPSDGMKRSSARAAFNAEVKKALDATLASKKAEHA